MTSQTAHRIGDTVRVRRAELGLTLAALATQSGVSERALSSIENGHSRPFPATVGRIASALDVPVATLMWGDEVA